MLDVRKDCAIKLFGKIIAWFPEEVGSDTTVTEKSHSSSAMSTSLDGKDVSGGDFTGCRHDEYESINPTEEALTEAATPSEVSIGPSAPGLEKDCLSPNTSKKEVPSESSAYQEKTLKKPDKILPCPRCNSMDTKFCYYNNYNVNQPRHFCRNCQRYWTYGGTMRNVPVGSGRRKNKSVEIRNYGHIMISDTLQAARVDAMNGVHLSSLKPNGFLTLGSDRHICEPMTSTLNYAERSQNCVSSEFCENSNGSSSPTSSSMEKTGSATMQESSLQNFQDKPSQVPCFPQHLWPCPWKSAPCMTPKPPSASGPCGFPVTFYPAKTFWSSAIPNPWNVPWASSASSSDPSALSTSTTSSALGKRSREEAMLRTSKLGNDNLSESTERSVLIPKTLRIDHPNEAAKSSIWSTLGIENEKTGSVNGIGLFQTCEPKGATIAALEVPQ